jgi:hypothetical protein
MTNFVPTGATIDSASLTFDIFNSSGSSYEIYALKRAWNESQVTWNQADNANNWQSAGANGSNDRDTQILGTVTATNTGSLTIAFNTAGMAIIQQWVNDPNSNYGIIIANSSSGDGVDFYSSEFSTTTSRPKLSLSYHVPVVTLPEITSPPSASALSTNTTTFNWAANDTTVSEWWLYVGTNLGAADIANSRSLGTATSHTVTSLPTDGSTLHVRLWYKNGVWKFVDISYTTDLL